MSERLPPTESSLRRGGIQLFGQEKRRFMCPENAMTNIAFRTKEIVEVQAPTIEQGITNFREGYNALLKCSDDSTNCKLLIIENGQIILRSYQKALSEIVTVGRNGRVLGVLNIHNNRININNECEFGSFPINDKNEHVAVLLPRTLNTPDLVKSKFLHIEFRADPIIVQFETSIDGGLFLSMVMTRAVIAFQRFDSASLNLTLAQTFRAIPYEELKEFQNINVFIDRFVGRAALQALENRKKKGQQLNDNGNDGAVGILIDEANVAQHGISDDNSGAENWDMNESEQQQIVSAEIHHNPAKSDGQNDDSEDDSIEDLEANKCKQQIVSAEIHHNPAESDGYSSSSASSACTVITKPVTYLILSFGRNRPLPKAENVFYWYHLLSGKSELPEEVPNERFFLMTEQKTVTRKYMLKRINTSPLLQSNSDEKYRYEADVLDWEEQLREKVESEQRIKLRSAISRGH